MDDAFGHWLAGFIDGEGCFIIHSGNKGTHAFRLSVNQRADDLAILEEIQRQTGCGRIYGPVYRSRGSVNPCFEWRVSNERNLRSMIDILDRYPLRAKKRHDYKIWRQAVLMEKVRHEAPHAKRPWYESRDWHAVEALKSCLVSGRQYQPIA